MTPTIISVAFVVCVVIALILGALAHIYPASVFGHPPKEGGLTAPLKPPTMLPRNRL